MMKHKSLPTVLAVAAVLCLLLMTPGCWNPFNPEGKDTGGGGEPPAIYDRTSRMNLMEFFARAHEQRNMEDYDASLHNVDYQFWFSEDDRSDPEWDWRDWIGKGEDVLVTGNMFEAEEVTDIRVTFLNVTQEIGEPGEEDNFYEIMAIIVDGDRADTLTSYWGDFKLDMHVVVDRGDEEVDHFVDGRAYIYLLPDPIDPDFWTVWRIEDRGTEHKKAADGSLSWTELKRLMRR